MKTILALLCTLTTTFSLLHTMDTEWLSINTEQKAQIYNQIQKEDTNPITFTVGQLYLYTRELFLGEKVATFATFIGCLVIEQYVPAMFYNLFRHGRFRGTIITKNFTLDANAQDRTSNGTFLVFAVKQGTRKKYFFLKTDLLWGALIEQEIQITPIDKNNIRVLAHLVLDKPYRVTFFPATTDPVSWIGRYVGKGKITKYSDFYTIRKDHLMMGGIEAQEGFVLFADIDGKTPEEWIPEDWLDYLVTTCNPRWFNDSKRLKKLTNKFITMMLEAGELTITPIEE
ncbi:hypothetical protein M1466_01320 [Candidatus Dependentiae bacterium]|nr:hypothetical protein [Candidatus Dependentiae bacterium]